MVCSVFMVQMTKAVAISLVLVAQQSCCVKTQLLVNFCLWSRPTEQCR